MKTHHLLAGLFSLGIVTLPLSAQTITATGDVSPSLAVSDTWTIPGTLSVGGNEGQTGSVVATGPGTVFLSTQIASLGEATDSHGSITLNGAGTTWENLYSISVGERGMGVLNIENGAQVSTGSLSAGIYIPESRASGTVNVTGEGSSLISNTVLVFGAYADGFLHITAGGHVANGATTLGRETTGVGTATVDGENSRWEQSGSFTLGNKGHGLLHIDNGGSVVSQLVDVGADGGKGTIVVSGSGSHWEVQDSLQLGVYSTQLSTLRIENGGLVTAADATFGVFGDAEVTVTGPGSRLELSGAAAIGQGASGSLLIEKGGVVQHDGDVLKLTLIPAFGQASLTVRGDEDGIGTLEVNSLTKGNGLANVLFDGGRLRSNNVSENGLIHGFGEGDIVLGAGGIRVEVGLYEKIDSPLTGGGGLIKEGHGHLALYGTHTYLGDTEVQEGAFMLFGSLAASSVFVASDAILGGMGTVGGDVTMLAGSKFFLQPSGLTVLGTVFLDSTFGVDDIIIIFPTSEVSAGFEIDPNGVYTLFADSTTDYASYHLENWGADNAYDLGNGLAAYFQQNNGLQLVFTTAAIPEPAACATLAGLGALVLVIARKRHQMKRAQN